MSCLIELKTEAEMRRFAEDLAREAFSGEFIALFGGLGAGKTTFVRYFAAALGVHGEVSSPTFNIVKNYRSDSFSIAHFDCYRLENEDELFAIGFDDQLALNDVILMEWSENVAGVLPTERLEIRLSGSGSEPRSAVLCPFGKRYENIIKNIAKEVQKC